MKNHKKNHKANSNLSWWVRHLRNSKSGVTMLEYVILGAMIAAASIGMVITLGNVIRDTGKIIGEAVSGNQQAVVEEAGARDKNLEENKIIAQDTTDAVIGGDN